MDDNEAKKQLVQRAAAMIRRSGFPLADGELERMEFVDFGLGRFLVEGLGIITLFATDRLSMKLLLQFPLQTEPEHWHPPVRDDPGKEEILRNLWGDLYVYTVGEGLGEVPRIPGGKESVYRCRRETFLKPGEQILLPAGAPHWFRAGPEGAVFLSISTCVRDGRDGFTDPRVDRLAPATLPSAEEVRRFFDT